MQISVQFLDKTYFVNLDAPIDIGMPLRSGAENANCFFAPYPEFWPVEVPEFGFIGDTRRGGAVNFYNVKINPHGNGTHTECIGHIERERYYLQNCLRRFHFFAKLVSVWPQKMDNGDRVILREQLEELFVLHRPEALILRTLPNGDWKLRQQYSGTNPPYVHHTALEFLVEIGVQHLLIDLPSVDREEDGGALLAHRAFWQRASASLGSRASAFLGSHASASLGSQLLSEAEARTITELIYVPEQVQDGDYLLNLQISSLELDASPSKPVLYALEQQNYVQTDVRI